MTPSDQLPFWHLNLQHRDYAPYMPILPLVLHAIKNANVGSYSISAWWESSAGICYERC